jgi:hypothetical protein
MIFLTNCQIAARLEAHSGFMRLPTTMSSSYSSSSPNSITK